MATVLPVRRFLSNAGSMNMAVNGSVTPVTFTMAVGATEIFSVDELILQMTGTGTINNVNDFWNFAALPNGLSSSLIIGGGTQTLTGFLKTNYDMIQFLGVDVLTKLIGSYNVVRGVVTFKTALNFNGARGDLYSITVRDNLTTGGSIEQFSVSMRGTMVTKP